ncbi:membrane-associated protease RseP (regulator of RpoE activity) [Mumia flava]|uniref:Membrane-associated protease RseP (Regulator of RpoE activity) n=1 Tax=Mumia flava TaxID=1348852 RepID=A0A0B2BLF4_9ACTN|nr:site-2 protease family protein [Mumia flava]PJJ56289.1 membrane-associated protease RseP (regulator of RpoE activity) [Mumia flava]
MSEPLLYALGVVVFLVGLAVSIALHEVGHMVPAKAFGAKVTQYFVGFGRTVWSRRRGETEYGLKAIPLGGFVKIVGMLPPHRGDDPSQVRTSNTGLFTQLVSDARTAEYEHVTPDDEPRLFYKLPWWKKAIVMAGGPVVNLAIAFALFAAIFLSIGAQTLTTTISSVSDCVIPAAEAPRTCTSTDPVAPAKESGLEAGDEIVSFNGEPIDDWSQMQTAIRSNGDSAATIGYVRDGETYETTVNTSVQPRPVGDDPAVTEEVGFLGVAPTAGYERQDLGYVVTTMGDMTVGTVEAIASLPQKMVEVTQSIFGAERADDTPMSPVGASRVAGEMVTIEGTTWTDRVYRIATLLAAVNLFVALFNFIPLLPLDGGHIAGALWEGLRNAIARLRRRPLPGPVDVGRMLPVAYGVGALLLVMGVILILADIINPVRLT